MECIRELIIDASDSEITVVLLEDKKLVELYRDISNNQFSVGDIFLGKVKKLLPGLNAAFVDIGHEKDAFLHCLDLGPNFYTFNKLIDMALKGKDVTPIGNITLEPEITKEGIISDYISEGQILAVQIIKEPISTKGPRLTAEISIAGRNIILMPFLQKISISQKISTTEEKARLKNLIINIKPKNYGVIVRTVAEDQKVAYLDHEISELVERWEKALQSLKGSRPPRVILGEMDRTTALIRDMLNHSFHSIFINNEILYNQIKDYIKEVSPDNQDIVKLYQGKSPIFEQFDVSKQMRTHFGKTVALKKGAYLVIEHTEALHVIDVNSGNRNKTGIDQEYNALDTNLLAADEIIRQLRLRDMGGIVVIDFIDMSDPNNKIQLYEYVKNLMELDRAKHQVLPLSKFGLMQITRQRVRPINDMKNFEICPVCQGKGEVQSTMLFIDEIENKLNYFCQNTEIKHMLIKVHPFIHAYLTKGFFSHRFKLQRKYKRKLTIEPDPELTLLQYNFIDYKEKMVME